MPSGERIRSVGLPDHLREAVLGAARTAGVEEACGLLVGRRVGAQVRIDRAVRCENIAPEADRGSRFEIDPRRVIEEERRGRGDGRGVVGFYHSHPASDPVPSEVDRRFMALWPESVWLIAGPAPESGEVVVRAWEPGRKPGEAPNEIEVVGGLGSDAASRGEPVD